MTLRCPSCDGPMRVLPRVGWECPACGLRAAAEGDPRGAAAAPAAAASAAAARRPTPPTATAAATRATPAPAAPPGAAPSAFIEDAQDDVFWGHAAAPQVPRLADRFFFGHEAVPGRHVLERIAASRHKLAGALLGFGFFAVFLVQAPFYYQLVLGAPLFEEAFKFGLAMVLVGFLPAEGGLRPLTLALRAAAALAVGAGFGVLEHYVTYADEDTVTYVGRILFHAVATGLSMVTFTVLERSEEVRVRWLGVLPAAFVHYLNNGLGVLLTLLAAPFGLGVAGRVGLSWAAACLLTMAVLVFLVPLRAHAIRRQARLAVARHFPREQPAWDWPAAPPA